MIYNKIQRVLVKTKWIFNHYNRNFSLELKSKVEKVSQKSTFTHKLNTIQNFQMSNLFVSSTVTECNGQDCGISEAVNHKSIRWRFLRRPEVKLTLDSDVPWFLPTVESSLFSNWLDYIQWIEDRKHCILKQVLRLLILFKFKRSKSRIQIRHKLVFVCFFSIFY